MSVSYTDRIDELGVSALIGTVAEHFDNAMAKSVIGIIKTELQPNPAVLADNEGHWRGLDDLEISQLRPSRYVGLCSRRLFQLVVSIFRTAVPVCQDRKSTRIRWKSNNSLRRVVINPV